MKRRIVLSCLAAVLIAPAPAVAGEWLAGDLHVHTTYSHDSYGGPTDDNTGPEDFFTLGFPVFGDFALAATRGLDYLAITDHNDVRSQADPAFGSNGVLGIPGYENSLDGHAQMLGARKLYPEVDSGSAAEVQALADALRANGGVFQVNHPANSETDDPDDLDWALGYAVQPETVEAWNGPHYHQPPLPAGNSHDDAVKYWQGWLDRGARVALTGGSDSHWVSTSALQGPGQPTTWIYADERSVTGVLDGLRRGRTFVSHQPPAYGGPRVFLEADADRDGRYETLVGGDAPAGTPARVRVHNAFGLKLQLITDAGTKLGTAKTMLTPSYEHRFTLPAARKWVRADVVQEDLRDLRGNLCPLNLIGSYCRNRILVFAMTSALYVR